MSNRADGLGRLDWHPAGHSQHRPALLPVNRPSGFDEVDGWFDVLGLCWREAPVRTQASWLLAVIGWVDLLR